MFCTVFPDLISRRIKDIDDIYITSDKNLRCGVTNTEPIVLHGLANAKLDSILLQMGFRNYVDLTDRTYHIKKLWYHLKLFFKLCIRRIIKYFY